MDSVLVNKEGQFLLLLFFVWNKSIAVGIIHSMIRLNRNSSSDVIIVTLSDVATLSNPFYLFVFTCIASRSQKLFTIDSLSDQSTAKERYNKFLIETDVVFSEMELGQYSYEIYEKANNTAILEEGLNLLESGSAELYGTETQIKSFTEKANLKQYEG